MKEIPILFSGSMVSAILAGRKTQTRRIVKPQPNYISENLAFGGWWGTTNKTGAGKEFKCRYGKPGDLLYCKETWNESDGEILYRASPELLAQTKAYNAIDRAHRLAGINTPNPSDCFKWKPSIFMPKSVARIWLRNTGVRVERLNDISEQDAISEGVELFRPVPGDGTSRTSYKNYGEGNIWWWDPRDSFRTLIQSIHGDHIWNENPWVWVISFEVLSTTGRNAI